MAPPAGMTGMRSAIGEMLEIVRRHHLRVPRDLSLLFTMVIIAEGIVAELDGRIVGSVFVYDSSEAAYGAPELDIRNPVIAKVIVRERVDTVVHTSVAATPAAAGGRTSMPSRFRESRTAAAIAAGFPAAPTFATARRAMARPSGSAAVSVEAGAVKLSTASARPVRTSSNAPCTTLLVTVHSRASSTRGPSAADAR